MSTVGRPWRVVIIRSWDALYPVNTVREAAMRAAIADNAPTNVEIYAEDVDLLRFGAGVEPEFAQFLRRKYQATRIDLVIASGIEPLEFAARNRDDIWPGVPIVFDGVIDGTLGAWKRPPLTTGVTSVFDIEGTLAIGMALAPSARKVYFVSGAADFDRFYLDYAMREAKRFGKLEVDSIAAAPMAETLERVAKLGPDAIVFYLSILRDGEGRIAGPGTDTMTQVARHSRVPVLAASFTQFRRGPVGGSSARTDVHGREAGIIARRVLEGADPESIPIRADPPPVCELDWNGLRRWNIPEYNVPANCEIVNRPPSLWTTYLWPLAALFALVVLQAALISSLVIQRRERRRAEARLRERGAELAQVARLSTVGVLTASIAHEINQPMGAILSNAEAAAMMLEQGTLQPDALREILADIRSEDLRASEVIQRLRKLLGQSERKVEALEVNVEVAEALRHVAHDAERRGVTLLTSYASDIPVILGDPVELQQVVINLVVNAMEAVASYSGNLKTIRIETRVRPGGAEIAVIDSGAGVRPEDEARLFQSTFTTKKDGMGFGLSIVRTIVEMHGGTMSYEPNVPHGAIFRVRFPAIGA